MAPTFHLSLDHLVVKTGDRLSGSIAFPPQTQPKIKRITVELGWHTEGRGQTDREAQTPLVIDPQQFNEGYPISFDLQIPPEGPITYNGALLRILWSVKASIMPTGLLARKQEKVLPFTVVCR
jgi:hypothetical protein